MANLTDKFIQRNPFCKVYGDCLAAAALNNKALDCRRCPLRNDRRGCEFITDEYEALPYVRLLCAVLWSEDGIKYDSALDHIFTLPEYLTSAGRKPDWAKVSVPLTKIQKDII